MENPAVKKSLGKLIVGEWNTRTIVGIAVGAALFGVLMVFGSIPVFTNTYLTTAMVIPVVVGALFGPLPSMATLLLGNVLADLIGGWGFWFDWSIGNAFLGFFVGLLPVYGAHITEGVFKVRHAIIYSVLVIVGNAVAFGLITPLLTSLFYSADLEITFLQSFASGISNTAVLIIVGIPILILLSNRYKARTNLKEEA
ncbi:MAG TPA: ECF-type riboflavin transporter substrate-binding protein [Feifaniaceae bacterium]|nr:ECF-type riboflavin transporter substrate-binding protein [Feifaniaceae bacterium]